MYVIVYVPSLYMSRGAVAASQASNKNLVGIMDEMRIAGSGPSPGLVSFFIMYTLYFNRGQASSRSPLAIDHAGRASPVWRTVLSHTPIRCRRGLPCSPRNRLVPPPVLSRLHSRWSAYKHAPFQPCDCLVGGANDLLDLMDKAQ